VERTGPDMGKVTLARTEGGCRVCRNEEEEAKDVDKSMNTSRNRKGEYVRK
jgi:hypothetical protein